jgi:SMI1 / KNR4 family (SUKH-1)
MSGYFTDFFSTLMHTPPFDIHDLSNGVRLIGHVPDLAPEAYLQSIYPPLSNEEIRNIEEQIARPLPLSLKQFFQVANGIHLFSCALSIDGLRRSTVRTGIESRQPFSIVTPNTIERPKDADDRAVFFGGYEWDGSQLMMSPQAPTVYRCARRTARQITQWPSFEEMLMSELARLSELFDEKGIKRDPDAPTIPLS